MVSAKEDEYYEATFREHANRKSMWLGSSSTETKEIYIIQNDALVKTKVNISEKLTKVFDELITNSVDHYIKKIDNPTSGGGPVSHVWVSFSGNRLTVSNNGPGFSVKKMEKSGLWSVESLCSREFSGSNIKDETDPDRVVGGQNGLGLKLLILATLSTTITTICKYNKKYYKQTFLADGNDLIVEPPNVFDLSERPDGRTDSYTKFEIDLDYRKSISGWDKFTIEEREQLISDFDKWIQYRIYYFSLYTNSVEYRHEGDMMIKYPEEKRLVYNYNGNIINITRQKWIELLGLNPKQTVMIDYNDPKKNRFPWYIGIGVQNKKREHPYLSAVNGIIIKQDSTHTTFFNKKLAEQVRAHIDKKILDRIPKDENAILDHLVIISVKMIPLPEFSSQMKDKITLNAKKWNIEKEGYFIEELDSAKPKDKTKIIQDEDTKKIWSWVRDRVLYDLSNTKKPKDFKNFRNELHTPAVNIGKENAILMVCEGDSAELLCLQVFRATPRANDVGYFTTRGVVKNALKSGKKIQADGGKKLLMSKDFEENKTIQCLIQTIGLDRTKDYAKNPEGDKDFAKLNYKYLVVATDQDKDGAQITGLIITLIFQLWPKLYDRGFFRKYLTPLARVVDKKEKSITRFYNDQDVEEYLRKTYGEIIPKHIEIHRYKGLSQHPEQYVKNDMIPKYSSDIYTITRDLNMREIVEIVYGTKTDVRKKFLLDETKFTVDKEKLSRKIIPASDYLKTEVKDFHLYNVHRKLKCYIDGLNIVGRKILTLCRQNRSKMRISSIAGGITKDMHYNHGSASAEKAAAYQAQNFTGSNNIPPLFSLSVATGTIMGGRDKVGQARYTDVAYNTIFDILYPIQDDPLLHYLYEGKDKVEPNTYVPIVPYAILESTETPATGWKIAIWGRDYSPVKKNVMHLIEIDPSTVGQFCEGTLTQEWLDKAGLIDLRGKVWMPRLKKKLPINYITGKTGKTMEISKGKYRIDGDNIVFTQLPFRFWSNTIKETLEKKNKTTGKYKHPLTEAGLYKVTEDITTDENNVHLRVVLKPGAIEWIRQHYPPNEKYDSIELCFEYYSEYTAELNFSDKNGVIRSFEKFNHVLKSWYVVRRDLYLERLIRGAKLERANLRMLLNKYRFIKSSDNKIIYPPYDFEKPDYILEYLDIFENDALRKELPQFNIGNRVKKETRHAILVENNFDRITLKLLSDLGSIKWNMINHEVINNEKSNFDYIDNINVNNFDQDYITKLREKILKLYEKILELESGDWKKIWLSELSELDRQLDIGIKNGWVKEDHSGFVFK